MSANFIPNADKLAAEDAAHLGTYGELFEYRIGQSLFMQTGLFLTMFLWRALGAMLLGMALMKMGVFSAVRSVGFYVALTIIGYLIGLSLVGTGVVQSLKHDFDFVDAFRCDWSFNYIGSIFVALGHIGLVMLICKLGVLKRTAAALSAIGRMALTNYLMHSLICAFIFYGWGLGMWSRMSRFETIGIVAAIWIFQALLSTLWLSQFRFGPMEWLWRTLTYWRRQPMLLPSAVERS